MDSCYHTEVARERVDVLHVIRFEFLNVMKTVYVMISKKSAPANGAERRRRVAEWVRGARNARAMNPKRYGRYEFSKKNHNVRFQAVRYVFSSLRYGLRLLIIAIQWLIREKTSATVPQGGILLELKKIFGVDIHSMCESLLSILVFPSDGFGGKMAVRTSGRPDGHL